MLVFHLCCQKFFLYLDIEFLEILFHVTFFADVPFGVFQKRHKDGQGFKEMKLFQKDRLKQ